ncbi:transcriptional repressor LexA [Candidatus Sumerlaeota bacterium]|nr:transcriptional repressor LexA [Candidatus Sumerlaeota bacterium]
MTGYLTKRQHEILSYIENFIAEQGYSPSLEELGRGLGLSSLATVHVHLRNLAEKNLIRRAPNRSRAIELVPRDRHGGRAARTVELPLLGRVAAGSPIEAIRTPESVELPEEFVRGKETFVLRVQGDSMIDEQIRDGDLVIVERRETAQNGDTVVALVDDREATIKKFYRESKRRVRLQPANRTMKPLVLPAEACSIQGVVIGLLRKY